MDRSLTAQEAADRLGYDVKHLYRLLDSGKVKGQRVGHIWLIDTQEVQRIRALQGSGLVRLRRPHHPPAGLGSA